jgi:glycine dehydrogenase
MNFNKFSRRHLGPDSAETKAMLAFVGYESLEELVDHVVPEPIRDRNNLELPAAMTEREYLAHINALSLKNKVWKNFIGQGYYGTLTPSVIQRNLFENPGWYTQYTPYQAEISQGRLESLLNFQTMASDLTGLPISNASLLDEGTAAAEAMAMFFNTVSRGKNAEEKVKFFVDQHVFPQTIGLLETRSEPIGVELVFGDFKTAQLDETYFGALVQYPNNVGDLHDYTGFAEQVHAVGGYIAFAADLLALTLLKAPGEMGADAVFGNTQRFGVPMGFGGPHAAYFTTTEEFKRLIPGRMVGISVDAKGNRALRLALQTREQHIKREKATSNICTAQALLANMAAMYAVYHGPKGLVHIAETIHGKTQQLHNSLKNAGFEILNATFFDTIVVKTDQLAAIRERAIANEVNLRYISATEIGISIDETTLDEDISLLVEIFTGQSSVQSASQAGITAELKRTSTFLEHPVFNTYHSETKMMRYLKKLENRDLSLNTSMITLGSCTMKLNAASELIPLSTPNWASIHPFAPQDQAAGYLQVIEEIEAYLSVITGMSGATIHPNSGAQGEYAGLLTIRKYHQSIGEGHRNIMLIPVSAHGTNPASAVMAGYKVMPVLALANGNIDLEDLKAKADQYADQLGGVMVTYPSTYGIYEETVKEIIRIVHEKGGQVYMDGANLNAQIGLTSPGYLGADVCHLNLHKTFAIPHGGGGPGVGPICVAKHLVPFLPGGNVKTKEYDYLVSSAPYGSAYIMLASYGYIRMMGAEGLSLATKYAILNANYMKKRISESFDILYSGINNTCAHEFIVDLRAFKKIGVEAEDVAKRMLDFNFHPPTLSFPVPGTIMVEPTESEDQAELDRFCDALAAIREELHQIEAGTLDRENNPLKNAPHTQADLADDAWDKAYTRKQACFPLPYVLENKFWPAVNRVNNSIGDRNLICTCEPVESYFED